MDARIGSERKNQILDWLFDSTFETNILEFSFDVAVCPKKVGVGMLISWMLCTKWNQQGQLSSYLPKKY
jgi:hypothetical protein